MAHHKQLETIWHVPPISGVVLVGLFASRLWARHIHDKFRDAVAVTGPSNAPQFPDPDLEIVRDFHLGNFRANRAQRHGSRRGA